MLNIVLTSWLSLLFVSAALVVTCLAIIDSLSGSVLEKL